MAATMLMLLAAVACGRVSGSAGAATSPSATSVASGTRTSPTPLPTPTGTNPKLVAADCLAAPAGSRTAQMGNDQISVDIPPGWTQPTSTGPSETLLLQLNAPPTYGSDSVMLQLHSFLGPRPGSSSHHELEIDAANLVTASQWIVVGSITDCSVGGENASFVEFSHGKTVEFRVYVLHNPRQRYPLLYVVVIAGKGAIDDQSMLDAKRVMGSWNWGT